MLIDVEFVDESFKEVEDLWNEFVDMDKGERSDDREFEDGFIQIDEFTGIVISPFHRYDAVIPVQWLLKKNIF